MSNNTVSIVGGTGYTGAELLRILTGHPSIEVEHVTSRRMAGTKVCSRLPNITNRDLEFEKPDPALLKESDVVFTCVPHTAAMNIVPEIIDEAKVVDLSADYRIGNRKVYESVYGVEHTSPELDSVYGLPEIHGEEIKNTNLVANPGCYPTSAILALAPLFSEGILGTSDPVVIDAKSGSSGAGTGLTFVTHHPEVFGSIKPYKVSTHRHMAEMDQELSLIGNCEVTVNFTPHLVPISRGILTTCHAFSSQDQAEEDVRELYHDFYQGSPFIRLRDSVPDLRGVIGSNFCDIGLEVDERTGRLIIVSAIDNLTKGASGQAVHNLNLVLGKRETEGLEFLGLYP